MFLVADCSLSIRSKQAKQTRFVVFTIKLCHSFRVKQNLSERKFLMLRQILFGGESGLSTPVNAGLALLRIFAGVAMATAHGLGKLPPSEQFVGGVSNLGFPAPMFFAWAASLAEFLGGAFLALGLFTRISSFFVACTMLTAAFGTHLNDPFQKKELALLYLFIALCFLLKGADDWSIDSFLRKGSY
jgi:putative oxidoreductase